MTILNGSFRLELENYAFILVRATFPFAFPDNRTPLVPIRRNRGTEHVLLDRIRVHERLPNIFAGGVDAYGSLGDEILAHRSLLSPDVSFQASSSSGGFQPRHCGADGCNAS